MDEYVTKEQVIDWYRPYGRTDEPIPFETLVSDLRNMKAADVAPVRHGKWEWCKDCDGDSILVCSECGRVCHEEDAPYCYCGAKMDDNRMCQEQKVNKW